MNGEEEKSFVKCVQRGDTHRWHTGISGLPSQIAEWNATWCVSSLQGAF